MSRGQWTSLGAVGAALAASACCIGPLVFALFGLGAFGMAATFERFRPLLTILTLFILGAAFYRTYRRQPVECADGSCAKRSPSRWSKVALWLVSFMVLSTLTFPYWSPVLLSAVPGDTAPGATVQLGVSGMTCGGCAVTVQRALAGVTGVVAASVDFESATATVGMTASGPPIDSLIAAVQKAGYQATLLKADGETP